MTTKLSTICLLCLALACNYIDDAYTWTAMGIYHKDEHPGKCAISDTIILAPGESIKPPGQCTRVTCVSADGLADIVGCGSIAPPPNCEWGDYINIEAAYPECCAQRAICENPANQTVANQLEAHVLQMFRSQLDEENGLNLASGTAQLLQHKEL